MQYLCWEGTKMLVLITDDLPFSCSSEMRSQFTLTLIFIQNLTAKGLCSPRDMQPTFVFL